MAKGNVVAEVRRLATASKSTGHSLHGAILTPAQWATEAGFPGSAASPMRRHMARQSGNGCGRNSRYGAQDADGMLRLLDLGDAYSKAEAKKQQDVIAARTRKQLTVRKAAKSVAKAKTVQRKRERAAKAVENGTVTPPAAA